MVTGEGGDVDGDARPSSEVDGPGDGATVEVGEVGEVSELFQWLPADEAADRAAHEPLSSRVQEELADVLLYLVRLADVLGVDLADAARRKLIDSSTRFDPDVVRGVAPHKG